MSELYEFDKSYNRVIAGVDEAGRGPLAGPVVAAAAVIKKYNDRLESINDSKKLSEKKREELYDVIMECFDVGVGVVDVEVGVTVGVAVGVDVGVVVRVS